MRGIVHELPVASAQVKSCLLLAGMFADGETWVHEPERSRDHTERMLEAAGVPILRDGLAVGVRGPVEGISLPDLSVPGDFSSAAFHAVAGCCAPIRRFGSTASTSTRPAPDCWRSWSGWGRRSDPGGCADMAGEPTGDLVVRRADGLRATDVVAAGGAWR